MKLKRSEKVIEKVELEKDGEVVTSFDIEIDCEAIALRYNEKFNEIIKAELAIKKGDTNGFALYGSALKAFFELLFGEENTKKLFDFYENKYFEISVNVLPFIKSEVQPKIKQAVNDMQAKARAVYTK